jgi:ubiquinone/menaquinone biosynthesis C-methylase UbiE
MNPYIYVQEAVKNGESLLSLCCGIGLELSGISGQVTAVDIAPQYLEQVKKRCPHALTVQSDSLEYLKSQEDKSVDVISIIDGLEHMQKETGYELIREMKRVARKKILLFVPEGHTEDGYLKNEPHNAWGIEGADEHQKHLSGWTRPEIIEHGFEVVAHKDEISQHNEPYTAVMYQCSL